MKQHLHQWISSVSLALILMLTTLSIAPATVKAGGSPCTTTTGVVVQLNMPAVLSGPVGSNFTINTNVSNCGAQAVTLTLHHDFTYLFNSNNPGCTLAPIASNDAAITLKPGETKGLSFNRSLNYCFPSSSWQIAASALDSTGAAVATNSLIVTFQSSGHRAGA
ncbi:MAG: hypothetical protein U0350_28440 [Caldilineaceae bacterium]